MRQSRRRARLLRLQIGESKPLSAENGPLEQVAPVRVLHHDVGARVQEQRDQSLVAIFSRQVERSGLAAVLSVYWRIVLKKRLKRTFLSDPTGNIQKMLE